MKLWILQWIFYTKTEFLNFKITLPLAKLVTVGQVKVSNGFIFSGDAPVHIQLLTL